MFKKLVNFIKTTFKKTPIMASTVVKEPKEDVVKVPVATEGIMDIMATPGFSETIEPEKKKRGRKKKTEE